MRPLTDYLALVTRQYTPLATPNRVDESTFRLTKDGFHSVLQRRKVLLDDCPDDVQVNLKVAVDQHVAHTDDLFPGNRA